MKPSFTHLAVVVSLTSIACEPDRVDRRTLDGLPAAEGAKEPDGAASISPEVTSTHGPDCESLFRKNDHVATFHCADDYLQQVAQDGGTADSRYFVYRGLSFLLAAPELSLGLNTFLGVFSVESALPWTKQLYGEAGLFEALSKGVGADGPVDVAVTIDGQPVAFQPRFVGYVGNGSGASSRSRLTLVEPYDAEADTLTLQIAVRAPGTFDVTDGTPIDHLSPCTAGSAGACIEDDPARQLDARTFAAWRDPATGAVVKLELDSAASVGLYASELGVSAGQFITLVARDTPASPEAELVFREVGAAPGTGGGGHVMRFKVISLIDKATPIENLALQKALAIVAPLTGGSLTVDEVLSDAENNDASNLLSDFVAATVRHAKSGSSLNDVYTAALRIADDLDRYAVADLERAYTASPKTVFVFPKEIFRTSHDLQLSARELKVIRTVIGALATFGRIVADALHIGGKLVTREDVWDAGRDDVDHGALADALNIGFLLVLDEQTQAAKYRAALSSQIDATAELVADVSSASCSATALIRCMPSQWGMYYHAVLGELATVTGAATSASTKAPLSHFQRTNVKCSDSWPNSAGACASIGAVPQTLPAEVDVGALIFTHRMRSPLSSAGDAVVLRTLANGTKRVVSCSMHNVSSAERTDCKAGATTTTPLFFDVLHDHVMRGAGLRGASPVNPAVTLDASLSLKAPDASLGIDAADEDDVLGDLVRPVRDEAAASPLSRFAMLMRSTL